MGRVTSQLSINEVATKVLSTMVAMVLVLSTNVANIVVTTILKLTTNVATYKAIIN